MQIDPRHLIQFAAIIKAGSFSAAAEELALTQPALSSMVKNLEERTGLTLLASRRRPVLPTALGRELAEKGAAIAQLIKEADQNIEQVKLGKKGQIRVAAPSFFCEYTMAEIITRFWQNQSQSNFNLLTGYQEGLYAMVRNREVDFAFAPIQLAYQSETLTLERILNLKHAVVCARDNPLFKDEEVNVDALQVAKWVTHSRESLLFQSMQTALTNLGVTSLDNALKSSSASALLQMVLTSGCLTVLPAVAILPLLKSGQLKILRFQGHLPEIPFGLIAHRHSWQSPLEQRFIQYARERLFEMRQEAEDYTN